MGYGSFEAYFALDATEFWRAYLIGPLFSSFYVHRRHRVRQHKASGLRHFLLLHFYSMQLIHSLGGAYSASGSELRNCKPLHAWICTELERWSRKLPRGRNNALYIEYHVFPVNNNRQYTELLVYRDGNYKSVKRPVCPEQKLFIEICKLEI